VAPKPISPYAPLNILKPVAPNVWMVDGPEIRFNYLCCRVLFPTREAVFFHRPSRTLVLTDLIENFEPQRIRGFWYRLLLRLAGAADPDGKAPIDLQMTFWRHRKAIRLEVERMIAWDPERIIIAHGRWYDKGGTAELRRAFRWVF
jgi:hypothetical protein